jgi:RNA recognition motif-containing protein
MDICVGNLPSDITGNDLRDVFEVFGCVETANVVRQHHSDESRGFGFVGMPVRSEGVCAVLSVHGRNLKGRTITANEIRSRDPVSGACRTRCHCRSVESAAGNANPISMAFTREQRACGTEENGLEQDRYL